MFNEPNASPKARNQTDITELAFPTIIFDRDDTERTARALEGALIIRNAIVYGDLVLPPRGEDYYPKFNERPVKFLMRVFEDIGNAEETELADALIAGKLADCAEALALPLVSEPIERIISDELKLGLSIDHAFGTSWLKDPQKYCHAFNSDSEPYLCDAMTKILVHLLSTINHELIAEVLTEYGSDYEEIPQLLKLYETATKATTVLQEIATLGEYCNMYCQDAIEITDDDAFGAYDASYARFIESFDRSRFFSEHAQPSFHCGQCAYLERWSSLNLGSLTNEPEQLEILKLINHPFADAEFRKDYFCDDYITITGDAKNLLGVMKTLQEYALRYIIERYGRFAIPQIVEKLKSTNDSDDES